MRLAKQSKLSFDNYLSIDYKNLNKRKNLNITKEPILNENVPIKVHLIKTIYSNPKLHYSKILKKNKSANVLKKGNDYENKEKFSNIKEFKKNKINKSTSYINSKKKEKLKCKGGFGAECVSGMNHKSPNKLFYDNKRDIHKIKQLLISSNTLEENEKPNKLININNINIKTHKYNSRNNSEKKVTHSNSYNLINNQNDNSNSNINFKSTKFTYNKPLKMHFIKINNLDLIKNNKSQKIIFTENNDREKIRLEKFFFNYEKGNFNPNSININKMKMSNSANKIHNLKIENENEDINEDIIKVSKIENKLNDLKTFVHKNPISLNLSTTPNKSQKL